jgi:hypothetical protein
MQKHHSVNTPKDGIIMGNTQLKRKRSLEESTSSSPACDKSTNINTFHAPLPVQAYACTGDETHDCEALFSDYRSWSLHEKYSHNWLGIFVCTVDYLGTPCRETFWTSQAFIQHSKNEHPELSSFCSTTGYLERQRLPKNYRLRFWCGFCQDIFEHGNDDTTEEVARLRRAEHIKAHYEAPGSLRRNARHWVRLPAPAQDRDIPKCDIPLPSIEKD